MTTSCELLLQRSPPRHYKVSLFSQRQKKLRASRKVRVGFTEIIEDVAKKNKKIERDEERRRRWVVTIFQNLLVTRLFQQYIVVDHRYMNRDVICDIHIRSVAFIPGVVSSRGTIFLLSERVASRLTLLSKNGKWNPQSNFKY